MKRQFAGMASHFMGVVLMMSALPVCAGLIAHYDFGDGDLYDNEVGESYPLVQRTAGSGSASVTLNAVDGAAVFAGGNASSSPIAWLETPVNLAPDDFTVSFWFRTSQVDQDHPFLGLFASGTSAVQPGTWQVHSSGSGALAAFFDGNSVSCNAPLHAANTWYHVVVRKDSDAANPISFHLTAASAGVIAAPLFQSVNNNITLDEFVLGVNRGTNQSYGMEMANVRIFDDSTIPLDLLYAEGITPGALPKPAQVLSFTADRDYVQAGAQVQLSWGIDEANTVVMDQGVGDVMPLTADGSGQATVTVNATTTFTLTAENTIGSAQRQLTVDVGPPRPNIVIILIDDMGITDTSVPFVYADGMPISYKFNDLYQTPNMEALASSGMLFSNAYAQTVCSPSRVSLMTGLNAGGHGVTSWVTPTGSRVGSQSPLNYLRRGMDGTEQTLPKWLSAAGYKTIHSGKAHFTYQFDPLVLDAEEQPTFIGFDVSIGGSYNGEPGSFLGVNNYASIGRPAWTIPGLEDHHGSDKFLTEACTIEALEEVSDAVAVGRPFFLHLSHYALHAPSSTDPRATHGYPSLSGSAQRFATMIEGMDQSIGDVLSHLESLGVAEDTLIMFLGDNGSDNPLLNHDALPAAGWDDFPLRGKKGGRTEGGSRIPLIISWAKRDMTGVNPFQRDLPIPAGSHQDTIVACWDLPVTAMSVAGLPIPAPVHGHDLSGYLAGLPGEHRSQEILIYSPHGRNGDYFANYREGDWKLTYQWEDGGSFELYHLVNDPTESDNLAATNPEKVLSMARGMARKFDQEWGELGPLWPTFGALSTGGIMGSLDLDGDGLVDANEDANTNGLVDANETDPDDGDTDDDGTNDYAERRLGLDPLDPGELLRLQIERDGLTGMRLTWPSQPGLRFSLRRHARLDDAITAWPSEGGIPAAEQGNQTSWVIDRSLPAEFFVIELE